MQKRECDKDTMVVFGALYFTILLFLSSNIAVAATNTSWVGGNGGSKTESVYCPKDHFIAHINYAKGLAIDPYELLAVKCRSIHDNNTYAGSKAVGNSTSVGYLKSIVVGIPPACRGEHEWVTGLAADTSDIAGIKVVKNLTVACGEVSGGVYKRVAIGMDKSNASMRSCPRDKIGIGITVKSGLYIDRLRLICEEPKFHSKLPPPLTATNVPQNKPTLLIPVVGSHASKQDVPAGNNWRFIWNGVNLATKYQLCAKPKGAPSGNCWHNKYHSGSGTGRVEKSVNIPQSQVGKTSEWLVRGCNNNNECGPWSSRETFLVVPDVVKGLSPENNAVSTTRTVHFAWRPVQGANSYRLVIFPKPGNSPFQPYYPELNLPNMLNLPVNGTSKTVTIPANLGNDLEWAVVACVNFPGYGLRCSIGYSDHDLKISLATINSTVKNKGTRKQE